MIKGKRAFLADILFKSKIIHLLPLYKEKFVVCNYHRIRPDQKNFSTSFDDYVFGPTVSEFEKQMTWLKHNTMILSEAELIDILQSKKSNSGPYSLVTFDDGYIDNYTLAFPVLKKFGIPAIFFIPTAPIITRRLGWWDIINYLVKSTEKKYLSWNNKQFSLDDGRQQAISFFLEMMKKEGADKTKELIEDLVDTCEIPVPDFDRQSQQLMNWKQIREIAQNNIAIGGHSHSHRVLATLSPQSQKEELTKSKLILEKKLSCPVNSLSYPVGNYDHFTHETQQIAQEVGYEIAFSFSNEINNSIGEINPYDIKRVSSPKNLPLFAGSFFLPKLFLG